MSLRDPSACQAHGARASKPRPRPTAEPWVSGRAPGRRTPPTMTVAIVTDSAASSPPELAAEHGVSVVPMGLSVGGEAYHDGDLGLDELLARLKEGVSTSGPSPGDFAKAIESLLPEADAVLLLTI